MSQLHAIQPLLHDGSRDGGTIVTEASSALEAAQKVVEDESFYPRQTPRVQVWAMNEKYSPEMLTLYSKPVEA
jgi:hypothetical protein